MHLSSHASALSSILEAHSTMKIVITGATGYIGHEVLDQCLREPRITSIIAIGRRSPHLNHPKLAVIIQEDFSQYPASVISQIQDANACIYCLGTNIPVKPAELNRKINFEYATSTAKMFASIPHTVGSPFRFIYLSGALPEKNPEKRIWFLADNRKMRGELENQLLRLHEDHRASGFSVSIARPGFVQPKGANVRGWLISIVANAIMLDDIGSAMVHLAIQKDEGVILENESLKTLAKKYQLDHNY
jgi:nucleoside-diphosphate-sugar epimerase